MGKFWNGYAWRDHFEPTPDRSSWGPSPLIPLISGLRRIAKVNELVNQVRDTTIVEGEMVFTSSELLEDVREGQRALNEAGKELFDKYDAVQRPIDTRHVAITPRGLELGGFVGVSHPATKSLVAMSDERIAETNRRKMAEEDPSDE